MVIYHPDWPQCGSYDTTEKMPLVINVNESEWVLFCFFLLNVEQRIGMFQTQSIQNEPKKLTVNQAKFKSE